MRDLDVPAVPHQGMDFIRCDISSSAEVDAAIVEVLAVSGRIDLLLNNTGINAEGGIESLTDEASARCFDINVARTLRTSRAVIPAMKKQRNGRIVNADSFAAIMPSAALQACRPVIGIASGTCSRFVDEENPRTSPML